jgi:hypothetical protein
MVGKHTTTFSFAITSLLAGVKSRFQPTRTRPFRLYLEGSGRRGKDAAIIRISMKPINLYDEY